MHWQSRITGEYREHSTTAIHTILVPLQVILVNMAVASAALGELALQRAARASIYAHAGQIMLRYFNHEHNRNDAELKEIRDSAQEWCIQYFKVPTFRDVRNSQDCSLN